MAEAPDAPEMTPRQVIADRNPAAVVRCEGCNSARPVDLFKVGARRR